MKYIVGTDARPIIKIISVGKITPQSEDKMENFKTRKLDATDYHKDHPYMKSLDKALTHYFVTKTEDPAEHGEDFEAIKIDILNSLFHPQAKYDKRVESPNKK